MQEVKDIAVINAKFIKDYIIEITFNNNVVKRIDLKNIIKDLAETNPFFEQLLDVEFFKNFSIKYDTLVWSDELDLAPEYLYENGITVKEAIPEQSSYFIESSKIKNKISRRKLSHIAVAKMVKSKVVIVDSLKKIPAISQRRRRK